MDAAILARAQKALDHVEKRGRDEGPQGRNEKQGTGSVVSISAYDLRALIEAVKEKQEEGDA